VSAVTGGVLLALAAALAYGVSDFIGGVASRRTSAWPVAFMGGVGGFAGALLLAVVFPGQPSGNDLAWGVLGGIGSGLGGAFLYRGFAAGRMGVVGPVSAVGSVLLPVVVGVLVGERPSPPVWVGILAALPGIWLVSREPAVDGAPRSPAAGLLDGVVAGIGFGLLFVATGQIGDAAGFWPLAVTQGMALVAVVATALLLGGRWRPHHPTQAWGLVAGLLATAGVLAFLLATQRGLLSVAAVLASLYPAVTILLAATVVKEHIHRGQAVGLVFCGAAVALVAAG
jgi:drug/metabolite transporter (DMT)-like permease